MDNEATSRLKYDRRLANRRGWVEPGELEQELAALPDAADKKFEPGDEPVPAPAPAAVTPPAPAYGADTAPGGGTHDA